MNRISTGKRARRASRGFATSLLMASTTVSTLAIVAAPAAAQEARPYAIGAGNLTDVINQFARQSGVAITYNASLTGGIRSNGLNGRFGVPEGLSRILTGTGLTYRPTGSGGFTLEPAPRASADTVQLGTLRVEGASGQGGGSADDGGGTAETPYFTAAPTAHISAETIDRYRGSSPADILRGTAGVMSGEARNSGSSIDVNIRGMQGFGRVATTVDGAENSVTVYQGYQGVSNRTFVDPDFIGGIDITKGADAANWGNAGSVAMRTLAASDVVEPGETWGIRLKGSIAGNTSKPVTGNLAGYGLNLTTLTPSATGLDRPSFLDPTAGSASIVGGLRLEGLDIVAGYAWRKRGNYHAGTKDGDGLWVDPVLGTNGRYRNEGYSNYRPGEEVLNTQLETQSWLFKATAQFDEEHSLRLGYTGFRSEGGDLLASRLSGATARASQARQTAGTRLDTATARYRWNPTDNDLLDLTANAYWTYLELRNPIRGGRGLKPENLNLSPDFRAGSNTDMWGLDVTNLSRLGGGVELTSGIAYRAEDTRGSRYTGPLEAWNIPRDAIRHEVAGFVKASYMPSSLGWLTLNAGLRYSHYWSKDRYDPYEASQANFRPVGIKKSSGAFSPSAGIAVEPLDGVQLYVNYSSMLRAPSIFESANAFNSAFGQEDLIPERSRNWELGANLTADGLLGAEDEARLKLGYFNWDVKNYISRVTSIPYNPGRILETINIPHARFEGLELSGHYGIGGFSADLSANYFLNVEFCRTKTTCESNSIYSDYATNHVQPEYTISLSLAQKLFGERLTLGGRANHVGPRAIGHGDVTGQGASQYISLVRWKPHTLVDAFAEVRVIDGVTAAVHAENLFDIFYIDPLGLITQPGPGRTFRASLTGTFGSGRKGGGGAPSFLQGGGRDDWSGLYAGLHAGYADGHFKGRSTVLVPGTPTADSIAVAEGGDTGFGSAAIGFQAGYNWHLPGGLVLGVEADATKIRSRAVQDALTDTSLIQVQNPEEYVINDAVGVQSQAHHDIDWMATLRARVGFALDKHWLIYGTGGAALTDERLSRDQYRFEFEDIATTKPFFVEKASGTRLGYTLGAGAEYAFNKRFSIKLDYGYSHFGNKNFLFNGARSGTGVDWTTRQVIGYEEVPPFFEPGHEFCAVAPSLCEPSQQEIIQRTTHTGASNITNGRRASNSLDLHIVKIGVNFRF